MYADDAATTLNLLLEEEVRVSKSSNALPNDVRLMGKAEDNVILHLTARQAASA